MTPEGRELAAFKQAIEEIGSAGWTTCQFFIQQRVHELLVENRDYQPKVLKQEYITRSPKYDCYARD